MSTKEQASLGSLGRGVLAGAAGAVALNAVTYLDMLLRGRPASDLPAQTAAAGLEGVGIDLGSARDERAEAAGALTGIATGLGVGVVTSVARAHGVRLSPVSGAVAAGALAMVASDGSAAAAGLTDPSTWGATDWVSDVVPHLVFGAATHEVVRRLAADVEEPTVRPGVGLLTRSFLLGVATGCRSSLGLAGAAWAARPSTGASVARTVTGALVVGELVADKLPQTPSRLEPQGSVPRGGAAVLGATALAARAGAHAELPAVLGALGGAVGTVLGATWRDASTWRPTTAALVEDAVALGLVAVAVRGTS